MITLSLSQIRRYPIKSMAGERLTHSEITSQGVPHDRRWALVDTDSGGVLSAKRFPQLMRCSARMENESVADIRLPNDVSIRTDDDEVHELLSEFVERPVALRQGNDHFDVKSLMLMTCAGIRLLTALLPKTTMSVERFRPNLLLDDNKQSDEALELNWVDRTFSLGESRLKGFAECPRCAMVTHGFQNVEREPKILELLMRMTGGDLGLYVDVLEPGNLSVGDPIEWINPQT